MQELTLPKGGKTMEEGTVVEWLFEEGETVSVGDPVVLFESDKMTSEVTSDVDGVLRERAVPEGETVPVGTVLGRIGDAGEEPADTASTTDGHAGSESDTSTTRAAESDTTTRSVEPDDLNENSFRATPSARRAARDRGVSLATVAAATGARTLTPDLVESFADRERGTVSRPGSGESAGRGVDADRQIETGDLTVEPVPNPEGSGVLGSPWARVLADAEGVSIAAVGEATGTDRVRAEEVREYLKDHATAVPSDATGSGVASDAVGATRSDDADPAAPEPSASGATPAVAREETLTGAAGVMFDRMERVNREYASTTTVARVDVTELMELYGRLSTAWDDHGDVSPSITAFVLQAVGRTLPKYDTLNAEVVGDREIRVYDDVNVGIAVDTDHGLLVPTVYGTDDRTVRDLSAEIARLATGAREGTLDREDLENGTFTVSNAGNLGAYINTPQINPPQTAILGVCAVEEEPGVVEGEVRPRKFMHLTLTYDHRIVEGSTAVGFLREVATMLESPESLLS